MATVNLTDMVIEIKAKDTASKVISDIKKDLQNFNKTVEELPNEVIQRFNNSINSINLEGLQTNNERVKQAILGVQKAWVAASNSAITYNQSLQKQIEAERVLASAKQYLASVQESISNLIAKGKTPSDKLLQSETIATNNLAKAEFQLSQSQQNAIKTGNRLDSTLLSLESSKLNLVNVNNRVFKSNEKVSKSQNKVNKSFSGFNLAKLFSMIYMVRRLKNVLQDAIESSASWVENLNLLEVTYKDATDSALGLVKSMSSTFGLDPNDIVQYSATFMQMANAMGQARDTAYTMSTALTQIALDLASLRNVTFGQAVSDFESAIAGQVKPVRKYGMDITSFSIDDLLARQGIAGSSTRMTMLDKQLARTILLIEQSRDAWGDYAKTINSFANQQKVLVAQYNQLLRALGDFFVGTIDKAGIATKAIWVLNGALMALTSIIRVFKPENMTSGWNNNTKAIKQYNEELEDTRDTTNGMLLSFDKFESLDTGNGLAENMTGVLESLLQSEYAEYLAVAEERMANMTSYSKDIRDNILAWFGVQDGEIVEEGRLDNILKIVKNLKTGFENAHKAFKPLINGLKSLFGMFNLSNLFDSLKNNQEFADSLAKMVTVLGIFLSGMLIFSKLSPFTLMVAGIGILLSKSPKLLTLFGSLFETLSGLIEPVMNLINALVPFITDIVSALLPPIIEIINAVLPLLTPITELVVALLPVIKDILDVMIDFIPIIVDMVKFSMPILEIFIKLFTWVAKVVDKLDILKYLFIAMNLPLYVISKHWDKISSAIEKAFGWISKLTEKIKDFLSSGKGKIADFFEKFFGGGFGNPVPIPQFASGGFPDSGQVFMARENGLTEMVGSIGNRTAVANNDQIVQGIQQGVYNAVMSAFQQNSGAFSSGGGDVYIDRTKVGRVVAKSVFDEGRRAGYVRV